MKKIGVEEKTATRIVSRYSDFDQKGWNSEATEEQKTEMWKMAFYELWRLQMTWGFAYSIEVRESRKTGVFVDILARDAYADSAKETMESMGFGNVRTYSEDIMIADGCDMPDDVADIFAEW